MSAVRWGLVVLINGGALALQFFPPYAMKSLVFVTLHALCIGYVAGWCAYGAATR